MDATGAGDAFCGTLAASLAAGADLLGASRRAVVAGALSVTALGARAGLPTAAAIDQALGGVGRR